MTGEQAAYGSTSDSAEAVKRVRIRHFSRAKEQGIKITGLTSYDFLSASIFDRAGIDFLLGSWPQKMVPAPPLSVPR